MIPGTVSSFWLLLLSCSSVSAAIQQVQFNQVINVAGDMTLQSFQFPDGSRIETYSQSQQQLLVNQQQPSIPANQVTGSTGSPFVQVSPASMQINTNGAVSFVGGQIEMTMSMNTMQQVNVTMDNTFVAMLSPDRQSWMIQESMRSINNTDMTVRMVKRATLDGEYMLIGRQTSTINTVVTPFGTDPSSVVNILGTGIQENEFQDGLRLSVRASQPMTMSVKVNKGIDTGMLTALQNQVQVNDFRYQVQTNLAAVLPSLNSQVSVLQLPIPAVRIQKMLQTAGAQSTGMVALMVAQRPVLSNPGGATGQLASPLGSSTGATTGSTTTGTTPLLGRRAAFRDSIEKRQQTGTPSSNPNPVATQLLLAPTFTPVAAPATLDTVNMRIVVPLSQTDGEYILLMQMMDSAGNVAPAQQGPQTTQPQSQSQPLGSQSGSNSTISRLGRRQMAPRLDQYGMPVAPLGGVIASMQQIDQMAAYATWGGQASVTEIMSNFMKGTTGSNLNSTSTPSL